jgi:hypothetical protein
MSKYAKEMSQTANLFAIIRMSACFGVNSMPSSDLFSTNMKRKFNVLQPTVVNGLM